MRHSTWEDEPSHWSDYIPFLNRFRWWLMMREPLLQIPEIVISPQVKRSNIRKRIVKIEMLLWTHRNVLDTSQRAALVKQLNDLEAAI